MTSLCIAGRYADRARIKAILRLVLDGQYQIRASWLDVTAENDAAMNEAEAEAQVGINRNEIIWSDAMLYFANPEPSCGRYVDLGVALAAGLPVLIVGRHDAFQDSIYLRNLPVCDEAGLLEAVKGVVG